MATERQSEQAKKRPRRTPMRAVDKAWLEMDSSVNLMIINGVMVFDGQLDYEEFKAVLSTRFVRRYRLFRQRAVERDGRMVWEDDPHFDLRAHVRRVALPAPGDRATLQELISSVINEPLDRRRPLWRFFFVENVEGGTAIVGRLHHAMADGIALIGVLLSMTGESASASLRILDEPPPRRRRPRRGLLTRAFHLAGGLLDTSKDVAKFAVAEAVQTLENPRHPLELVKSAGIIAASPAAILTKLLILPPDRPSVYKSELGAIKRVSWSRPLELARIKAIGKAAGATINDVLVAAVAGALRDYQLYAGDDPHRGNINAMVPVNLRSPDDFGELGNKFALVYLNMPVSVDDPLQRLLATKRQMDVLKNSPEPLLVYEILAALGTLPGNLAKDVIQWFTSKASLVLTNVPGPRQQIYMVGKPIKEIMFWVPQAGEIGLGVSIISYNGWVTLGLIADERVVADPQFVMDAFERQFEQLAAQVLTTEGLKRGELEPAAGNGADVSADVVSQRGRQNPAS